MKRQLIIDAMRTRFAGITTASGYYTDFSKKVHFWLKEDLQPGELPAIVVRDIKESIGFQTTAGPADRYTHTMTVEIAIAARTDDTGIRKMMADVYKAIGVDDTWSGHALTTDAQDDEIVVEQESFAIQGAVITIVVTYITDRFKED